MKVSLVAVVLWAASTVPAAAGDWPASWRAVADGRALTMEIAVEASGEVHGTLDGAPVDGLVAGDRLLLTRTDAGRTEVWSALRGTAPGGESFLSGTVDSGGVVSPWYALPTAGAAEAVPIEPAPQRFPAPEPTPDPAAEAVATPLLRTPTVAPTRTPVAVPERRPPVPDRQDQLSLGGRWSTPTGEVTIFQEGSRLEVVDPSGEAKSGRMTGETSFVVGLRVGCCRGELTGPGMIRWEDDTVWVRAE